MLLHWFNVHLWEPMWPNVFAPSVFTLLGVIVAHLKTRKHLRRNHEAIKNQHEDLKQHVTDQINQQTGTINDNINLQASSERIVSPETIYKASEGPFSTGGFFSQENPGRKET